MCSSKDRSLNCIHWDAKEWKFKKEHKVPSHRQLEPRGRMDTRDPLLPLTMILYRVNDAGVPELSHLTLAISNVPIFLFSLHSMLSFTMSSETGHKQLGLDRGRATGNTYTLTKDKLSL